MIIDLEGKLGRKLIEHGVTKDEILATDFVTWPCAGALTAPISAKRVTVFVPRAWIGNQTGYGYAFRHEFYHVRQARTWGRVSYWMKHVAARIKTRSMLAKDDPVEIGAYDAERKFLAE